MQFARATNLGGFLPVRDFWEAQTGSEEPAPGDHHRSNWNRCARKESCMASGLLPPKPDRKAVLVSGRRGRWRARQL